MRLNSIAGDIKMHMEPTYVHYTDQHASAGTTEVDYFVEAKFHCMYATA